MSSARRLGLADAFGELSIAKGRPRRASVSSSGSTGALLGLTASDGAVVAASSAHPVMSSSSPSVRHAWTLVTSLWRPPPASEGADGSGCARLHHRVSTVRCLNVSIDDGAAAGNDAEATSRLRLRSGRRRRVLVVSRCWRGGRRSGRGAQGPRRVRARVRLRRCYAMAQSA